MSASHMREREGPARPAVVGGWSWLWTPQVQLGGRRVPLPVVPLSLAGVVAECEQGA